MENSGWKSLRLFLGALAICGSMSACTTVQYPQHSPDVSGAIKSKADRVASFELRPFDPKYFDNQQHLSIYFRIEGRGLTVSDRTPPKEHSGPLPYRPGGDTLVVYEDKNKKEIGHYTIADPTKLRSCDLTRKGGGYVIHRCQGDEVELLFPLSKPPQREIHYVKIIFSYTEPQEERFEQKFDVSKILEGIYGNKTPKNVMRQESGRY
jgi:hypothetical protein